MKGFLIKGALLVSLLAVRLARMAFFLFFLNVIHLATGLYDIHLATGIT